MPKRQQIIGKKPDGIPPELAIKFESLRCLNSECNHRFLGYYAIIEGTIAIKCPKCKSFNLVDVSEISPPGLDKKSPLV